MRHCRPVSAVPSGQRRWPCMQCWKLPDTTERGGAMILIWAGAWRLGKCGAWKTTSALTWQAN